MSLSDLLWRARVARGRVGGISIFHKCGTNTDVGTGAYEAIWSNGGAYPFPTTAETVRVKAGGNANDTAAGTGARSVTIYGLNDQLVETSETIATNGTSASAATSAQFFRVWGAAVASAGVASSGVSSHFDGYVVNADI